MKASNHIKFVSAFVFMWSFVCLNSLISADTYFFHIKLSNKNNSIYSLNNPSEFLSARSIQRRTEQSIAIDSTDLPVNSNYISQIEAKGVSIHSKSKWINSVTVTTSDTSIISQIRALSFVTKAEYTGKILSSPPQAPRRSKRVKNEFSYGAASSQTNQLNGAALHNLGYTGRDVLIGVIDAGFKNVDTNPAFDSLRLQNRLLATKSIINPNIDIYQEDAHGANVLSIMAGNLPSQFLGVAPHASYALIQTEYVPAEYPFEVDFWVSGIEYADSIGVDIINSSLGYSEFDEAGFNYSYANMNGSFSRASVAANLAAQKGIVVCSSAGNEGAKPWKYISAPADADGIITVGAVNNEGTIASFSSFGPTADNRVKPDVCAVGWGTALVNSAGSIVNGSGTSYSSPVITGLTACLIQYCKENLPGAYTVETIRQNLIASADRFSNPHEQYGYGLPDYNKAINQIITNYQYEHQVDNNILYKFDRYFKTLEITIASAFSIEAANIQVVDLTGKIIVSNDVKNRQEIINLQNLTEGVYIITVKNKSQHSISKLIIP
ncbi:S8 family serine peptidase [Paludibacter sp.]